MIDADDDATCGLRHTYTRQTELEVMFYGTCAMEQQRLKLCFMAHVSHPLMGHVSGHGEYPDNWIIRDAVICPAITNISKSICESITGPIGPGPNGPGPNGPGPNWPGPNGPRPKWARVQMGPGPNGPGPTTVTPSVKAGWI